MISMTQEQKDNFLSLVTQLEDLKDEIRSVSDKLNQAMAEVKFGTYIQDDITGLVYKIVKPNGTFTYYKDLDYVRTAKDGERSGSLSKKEAEENGFAVLKK